MFVLEPDASGVPRYAAFNAYACKILGRPCEDILGRTAAELYPGPLGESVFANHCEAMRSGEVMAYETRLPIWGEARLVRTTLRAVCDDSGAVLRLVGSSVAVSGGQDAREAQEAITAQTHEMQNYIELAAHDLRAPMRNVTYIAEMLREDFEDLGDGKLELIDLLEDIGTKASGLISDVLAHAEASSLVHDTVRFDFAELASDVISVLDPMGRTSLTLEAGIVEGDRAATQIILRNLIDNAMKHCASGPNIATQLTLDIRVTDSGDGFFQIVLSDNGTGFSDPALLFLDSGQLRVDSGFGLLGVRRLIHARGGSIKAANAPEGRGAVVTITLPGSLTEDITGEASGAA